MPSSFQNQPSSSYNLEVKRLKVDGYYKVVEFKEKKAGLHAIIAVHDVTLGPSLGGTRMFPYANFDDALHDALRLAKGMTYKSALAEVGFGGGKGVIIANPKTDKTHDLLLAFAEAVNTLEGEYICGEDSGTSAYDMLVIRQRTSHVIGFPTPYSSGDPSRFAAWGVYKGIKAAAKKLWGSDSLKHRTVAIQGLGSVGAKLAEFLFWDEVNLIVSDLDEAKVTHAMVHYQARPVPPLKIYSSKCDIFSPCAFGGILNSRTIPELKCKAVAGSANNQLLEEKDGLALLKRGILYAPDFVVNAGGVIDVALAMEGPRYTPQKSIAKINQIFDLLLEIFDIAEKKHCSTAEIALQLAESRLQKAKNGKK